MSQFNDFNAENKLRIPLTAYAAHIIENDCFNFSKKKTTLINAIILNYNQTAACSISLRLREYKEELASYSKALRRNVNTELIDQIIAGKAKELTDKYARRYPADVSWQITLSKKTKELLTIDSTSCEEQYYGQKPGHYVRALLEEYTKLPHYLREEIIFKPFLDEAKNAIDRHYILKVTTENGICFSIKPHSIMTDPLSMFHYLIGYNANYDKNNIDNTNSFTSEIISLRISRLISVEQQYSSSGKLTETELATLSKELKTKGVQFITSKKHEIQIWLSDDGIKKYESQAHLRPPVLRKSANDEHIYYFECTDSQILFYFFKFGQDAKIISPPELAFQFKKQYKEAYELYDIEQSDVLN